MSDPNVNPSAVADNTAPAAQPATQTGTPAASTAAIPNVPATAPATGAPEGWVPPHRIRETREAAIRQAQSEFAKKEAALNARIQQYEANLRALVGVQPPQNPEIDAVRQQFGHLYPGLAKLEERYGDIEKVLSKIEELEEQNNHYWGSHAQSTVDRLYSVAEDSLGTPLGPDAKHHLYASFVGYIQANPDLEERYKTDANSLVKDFWKAFSASFIDPYRRSAAVDTANRIPSGLPQDTPGGAPQATPSPTYKSLDERAKAAWSQFNTNRARNS